MSRNSQKSQRNVSAKFNANDADVVVKSEDDIIFKLHRTNIEVQTGAFPTSLSEPLSERAHVLEILFQFLYPQNHPKLTNMIFEQVLAVATAAEKYKVFAAMNVSQVRLREFLPLHAKEILSYALCFEYPTLINETALLVARSSVYEVLLQLPSPETLIPWARYHEAWDTIFDHAMYILEFESNGNVLPTRPECMGRICKNCQFLSIAWIGRLKRINNIPELEKAVKNFKPESIDGLSLCNHCRGFGQGQCEYMKKSAEVIEEGVKIMKDSPFVHYLGENSKPMEDVFTTTIAAIKALSLEGPGGGCIIV